MVFILLYFSLPSSPTVKKRNSEGETILRRSMNLNPYYPPYFHHAFSLEHYRKGDYVNAMVKSKKFIMPEYFWDPLDKAIALAALDRLPEANQMVMRVIQLIPQFETIPEELMSAIILDDQLKKEMLISLFKAGFEAN